MKEPLLLPDGRLVHALCHAARQAELARTPSLVAVRPRRPRSRIVGAPPLLKAG